MEYLEWHGRRVYQITSDTGQRDYYEHLNYWRVCYANSNPLAIPTQEDAFEYQRLQKIENKLYCNSDKESRARLRLLNLYKARYDWRPRKSYEDSFVGLVSPAGEQLLPHSFADVFTQFDAINDRPVFVPVSNGEEWGLVSLSKPHILMTAFRYNAIIPERWERHMFFVQDKETMKWGALSVIYPFTHTKLQKESFPLLIDVMPPIANAIYEDELITDELSMTIFMTQRDGKIGILTDFGYSDIIYEAYEADDAKKGLHLFGDGSKGDHSTDHWHSAGKKRNKI